MGESGDIQFEQCLDGDNRFLAKLSRHTSLGPAEIASLEKATSRRQNLAPRRDLIREGDRPGPVFVVLEGWVCRYKILPSGTRQVLAFLMPGDCCDLHVSLLAEMDHSIQTITHAVIARIGRDELDAIMDLHPNVAKAIYKAQLVDAAIMRAWITCMGRRTSVERVAHLMCELFLRALDVGLPSKRLLSLPLSQTLLADALGMTPVHLNRVAKELRMNGAMSLQRGCLNILDSAKLARIAGFDENYLHRRARSDFDNPA